MQSKRLLTCEENGTAPTMPTETNGVSILQALEAAVRKIESEYSGFSGFVRDRDHKITLLHRDTTIITDEIKEAHKAIVENEISLDTIEIEYQPYRMP